MSETQKHTKPNVPNLRFPGFTGGWESRKIGEDCSVLMCKRIFANQTSEQGDVPFYKIGTIGAEPDAFISKELFDEYKAKYNYPRKGEVMITCAGTVGKTIVFNGDDSYYQDSNIVWLSNPKQLYINSFLNYYLTRVNWNKLNSTTITRIYNDNLRELVIKYPCVKEQEKIVSLLSLLDQRIAVQSKVIEDLKKLKVAISRFFFIQKPICKIPLCSMIEYGKAGGTPKSSNRSYYNGNIPFLSINDITKQGKFIERTESSLSSEGLKASTAWLVPSGSLILSMYASVGLPAINKIPLATSQAMFSMVLKDKRLTDYLFYYLTYFKDNHIHRYLETGTQSNINAEIVKSILVPDFGVKNQYIGQVLSSLDKNIYNEERIFKLLVSQKKLFIQQLFI